MAELRRRDLASVDIAESRGSGPVSKGEIKLSETGSILPGSPDVAALGFLSLSLGQGARAVLETGTNQLLVTRQDVDDEAINRYLQQQKNSWLQ